MKKTYKYLLAFISILWIAFLVLVLFRQAEYIDLNSGETVSRTEWGPFVITSRVSETQFSRLIPKAKVTSSRDWRLTAMYSPVNQISPHCRFHDVPSSLFKLVILWNLKKLTIDEQRKLALQALDLLHGGNAHILNDFVDSVQHDYELESEAHSK